MTGPFSTFTAKLPKHSKKPEMKRWPFNYYNKALEIEEKLGKQKMFRCI